MSDSLRVNILQAKKHFFDHLRDLGMSTRHWIHSLVESFVYVRRRNAKALNALNEEPMIQAQKEKLDPDDARMIQAD